MSERTPGSRDRDPRKAQREQARAHEETARFHAARAEAAAAGEPLDEAGAAHGRRARAAGARAEAAEQREEAAALRQAAGGGRSDRDGSTDTGQDGAGRDQARDERAEAAERRADALDAKAGAIEAAVAGRAGEAREQERAALVARERSLEHAARADAVAARRAAGTGGERPPSRLERFLGVGPGERDRYDTRYLLYLLVIALAGWALASYDFNLLVVALPTIAKALGLTQTQVGLLAFFVYGAMLILSLAVGYAMDQWGRKVMWQVALVGAAVFTGLTFFVHSFWWLVVVRALASGLANSELAISITLVNEQMPSERRGFLYGIVQGGWPLGVLLAAGVFIGFHNGVGLDWNTIFLLGVVPLVMVIIGRRWVRPSKRFQHVSEIKEAKQAGDDDRVEELLDRYEDVDVDEIEEVTVKQLFTEGGWVTKQLVRTTIVWLLYSAAFVAANTYIIKWLTTYRSLGHGGALALLLVASGIGFFFYAIGGALGERFGRQRVLIASALCSTALYIGFYFASATWLIWVLYVLLYQATNGTWSGTGYAYWAESFPTRVRGTAIGWLGAMFTGGLIIGAGVWTVLIGSVGAITFLLVGGGFAIAQTVATLFLPHIPPGQELEEVAT